MKKFLEAIGLLLAALVASNCGGSSGVRTIIPDEAGERGHFISCGSVTFVFDESLHGSGPPDDVYVAGDFNAWNPEHDDWGMAYSDDGIWLLTIPLDDASYESLFKFVAYREGGVIWHGPASDGDNAVPDGVGGYSFRIVSP